MWRTCFPAIACSFCVFLSFGTIFYDLRDEAICKQGLPEAAHCRGVGPGDHQSSFQSKPLCDAAQ